MARVTRIDPGEAHESRALVSDCRPAAKSEVRTGRVDASPAPPAFPGLPGDLLAVRLVRVAPVRPITAVLRVVTICSILPVLPPIVPSRWFRTKRGVPAIVAALQDATDRASIPGGIRAEDFDRPLAAMTRSARKDYKRI
jgi:hypothetical protein